MVFASEDPQSAYAAFTKGIWHRWTYVQRTIPETSKLFEPLETCIQNEFLPSLIGRPVSDVERRILALPPRFGGIGIRDPSKTADLEFSVSCSITNDLSNLIGNQTPNIPVTYRENVNTVKRTLLRSRDAALKTEFEELKELISEESARYLTSAAERGASAWMTVLPLKSLGYSLNKREFKDAMRLRYG